MFKIETIQDAFDSMRTRAVVWLDGHVGLINSIAVEDGSGRNWLITLQPLEGKAIILFVKQGHVYEGSLTKVAVWT